MIGDYLGSGKQRDVYCYKHDPSLVIKFPRGESGARFNILEYENHKKIIDFGFDRWISPCLEVGKNGEFLIMKRTNVADPHDYPRLIPSFFKDIKFHNWGILNGIMVCHDYQEINERLLRVATMRNVKWR